MGHPMVPDPILLLKREHEMILDRLRMIETAIAPRAGGPLLRGMQRVRRATTEPDRPTLRELLRFFTESTEVHFKREAVLITALNRALGRTQKDRNRFENLLCEHRTLKTDAAGIAKTLGKSTADADPLRIRSFIELFRAHLSCEERILFVLAGTRLTAEQRLRMSRRMLQV
ncbi:MAG: hemerythrin domain-containing protein [Nitrospira sp.]|nr:hemerythrin domain-containing protein [Nitrospira sp.]